MRRELAVVVRSSVVVKVWQHFPQSTPESTRLVTETNILAGDGAKCDVEIQVVQIFGWTLRC